MSLLSVCLSKYKDIKKILRYFTKNVNLTDNCVSHDFTVFLQDKGLFR